VSECSQGLTFTENVNRGLGEQDSNVKTVSKGNMYDNFDWIHQAAYFFAVLST